MPDIQVVDSVELRTRIGDYLNRVRLLRQAIGISQRKRLVAVLVPIEEWEALRGANQADQNAQ